MTGEGAKELEFPYAVEAMFTGDGASPIERIAEPFLGRRGVFRRLWLIEPEDSASLAGQYAWAVPREWVDESDGRLAWVSSGALSEMHPVPVF